MVSVGDTHTGVDKIGISIKIKTTISRTIGKGGYSTCSYPKISFILTGKIKIVFIRKESYPRSSWSIGSGVLTENISNFGHIIPRRFIFATIRKSPIDGHIRTNSGTAKVWCFPGPWVGNIKKRNIPFRLQMIFQHIHLIIRYRTVEEENFPDLPGSSLIENEVPESCRAPRVMYLSGAGAIAPVSSTLYSLRPSPRCSFFKPS